MKGKDGQDQHRDVTVIAQRRHISVGATKLVGAIEIGLSACRSRRPSSRASGASSFFSSSASSIDSLVGSLFVLQQVWRTLSIPMADSLVRLTFHGIFRGDSVMPRRLDSVMAFHHCARRGKNNRVPHGGMSIACFSDDLDLIDLLNLNQ